MKRNLLLIAPLLFAISCAEPAPFSITIENDTAETLGFDQVYDDPVIQLTVLHNGEEKPVLNPHGGCYRPCGKLNQQVCMDMAAPEEGAYVLLSGDALLYEHDGTGWVEDSDSGGECDREITLTGVITAELSWGFDLVDEDSGDPVDPAASGFVDGAIYDVEDTVSGELDLDSETELTLLIAP